MKNLINKLTLIGFLSLFSMTFAFNNTTEIPYELAKNYFVRNDYPDQNLHMVKITTEEKFESIFGMATLMGKEGKPTEIDFSKSFVIALIDNTSNTSAGVSVKSLVKSGGELHLIYDLKTNEKASSASFRHFTILIVDKKYEATVKANATPHNGNPIVGGDLDDSGCKPSTGYSWSVLENECIQPWMTKYVFEGEMNNSPLIFSKDNTKAEILKSSKFENNLILTKKGKSKVNTWVNGNLTLIQTKKDHFVLKDKSKEVAKAVLRK